MQLQLHTVQPHCLKARSRDDNDDDVSDVDDDNLVNVSIKQNDGWDANLLFVTFCSPAPRKYTKK